MNLPPISRPTRQQTIIGAAGLAVLAAIVGIVTAVPKHKPTPAAATSTPAAVVTTATTERPPYAQAPAPTQMREATEKQYTAAMISAVKQYQKWYGEFDDDDCRVVDRPMCGLYLIGLKTEASIMELILTGAVKPGVPAFIGAPPATMTNLVNETIAKAKRVETVADHGKGTDTTVWLALSGLDDMCDQWSVYF